MNKKQKRELQKISRKKNKNKKNTQYVKNTKIQKTKKEVLCFNCMNKNKKDDKICTFCNNNLLLNNRYYLFEKLGENIGVTYLVLDTKTKKKAVIKELSLKKIKTWKDEELFKREASILTSINHDEIPDFIDYFEVSIGKKVKYYTVMEFIDGKNLEELSKDIKYSDEMIILLIREIAIILDYLHNLNPPIIHRDIKLTNILRRRKDKKYVLIDFGSVINTLKPNGDSTIAGTFGYMAPEQFMGKATVKSDYYSLGVVALELLTNKKPIEFINGVKLNWYNADISDYMKDVLSYLLAENPDDRIGSFDELNKLLGTNKSLKKDDQRDFMYMYNELKKNSKLKKYNLIDKISFLILFLSSIFFLSFIFSSRLSILSLIVIMSSIIVLLGSSFVKYKKQNRFLEEYFSYLTEKEVVFLEIILKKYKNEFSLSKKDFYHLYEEAIKNKTLDLKRLIKYSEKYKSIL